MYKKKSLGQNFLKSPKIIDDIVCASGTKNGDVVLEIGPGEGTLTSALLGIGAKVTAVEKDDRLIPFLSEKFEKEIKAGKFLLIHGDALELNLSEIQDGKYSVVANIPYYITGQIIRKFFEAKSQPDSMTLLLQKEVAERIVAKDGKESLLSISVKAYGTPKYIRGVGRGAFSPSPSVDSAILSISNISRQNLDKINEQKFFETLHAGFSHKRKLLFSNLSSLYSKDALSRAFEICSIDLKARAENLPIEEWLKLSKNLS